MSEDHILLESGRPILEKLMLAIIIQVTDIFEKPERTEEVRTQLARNLGEAVKGLFPNAKVECSVHPFNPHRQGFWTSAPATQAEAKTADPASRFLAMSLQEFFTVERFVAAGIPTKPVRARILALQRRRSNLAGNFPIRTIGDIVKLGAYGLLHTNNCGETSVHQIKTLLAKEGITLPREMSLPQTF